jgi:uncharacterized membrane protein YjgN (DUF898 family)
MTAVSTPSAEPMAPAEGRGHFFGSKWEYRRILWGAMLALIVTLGLHRFTVTTNIRRYLWSRTDFAGQQLDYTGDAIELLIGFLVLIVVLAPLLVVAALYSWTVGEGITGLVQLALVKFAPLLLLYGLAVLGLYQARRYRLNHTIFRGLCFRQTGSAWIFFVRVVLWTIVVIVTLGLAYPWARADLERYKMRNTYYGDIQGSFEGSALELFKRGFFPWLAAMIGIVAVSFAGESANDAAQYLAAALLLVMFLIFYPIFRALVVKWRIAGMRFGALSFESNFSTWRFAIPYLKFFGWMLVLAIMTGIIFAVVRSQIVPHLPIGESYAVEIFSVVCLTVAYFIIATIISFAFQGTVRFETWRLIVDSLVLRGIGQLDRAKAPAAGVARRKGRIGAALNLGGF